MTGINIGKYFTKAQLASCERHNINPILAYTRILRGWSMKRATTVKVAKRTRHGKPIVRTVNIPEAGKEKLTEMFGVRL